MTTKKKKQASIQQSQKSGSGSTAQPKTHGRFKMKPKQRDQNAKYSSPSIVPFTKYGIGYASLVLIIGMYFVLLSFCYFLGSGFLTREFSEAWEFLKYLQFCDMFSQITLTWKFLILFCSCEFWNISKVKLSF